MIFCTLKITCLLGSFSSIIGCLKFIEMLKSASKTDYVVVVVLKIARLSTSLTK